MSTLNVNTIANASGTTAATIDSAGRILQPAKPFFHVSESNNTGQKTETQTWFGLASCTR